MKAQEGCGLCGLRVGSLRAHGHPRPYKPEQLRSGCGHGKTFRGGSIYNPRKTLPSILHLPWRMRPQPEQLVSEEKGQ